MSMGPDTIRREYINGIIILHPVGRIDSANAAAFEGALVKTAEDSGPVLVVVNLAQVPEIGATGLRALLMAAKKARAARSRIVLAAASPPVRDALAGGGVLSLFETHPSVEAALAGVR